MTVHIGILGNGNISQTHARAAREIEGAEIVAVYGRNVEKAKGLAELHGGRAYADLESFLRHQPMEIVLIGSPSGLHAAHGIQAARHGLHVLVEKPIDITTAKADALIAACEQAGVKLGVFFQDRMAPDIHRLKILLDEGRLGKPLLVSARVRWYRPPEYYEVAPWRGDWMLAGGGALMNQGVHTVDLLWWLLGDVTSVWGKAITALHHVEVEDTVIAGFEFSNGAVGTLEAATSAYPGSPRSVELTGSEGTVVLENDRLVACHLRTPIPGLTIEPEKLQNERSASPVISDTRGHRAIIEDFLQAIATDSKPLCDGHQARPSVELVQAIYESSRTGQAIKFEQRP